MTQAPKRIIRLLLLLAPLYVIASGCEESVSPFVESDRYFSIFGALDMKADTQYVRVIPIDTTIIVSEHGAIDARVFLTDLTTSSTVEWTDSLFVFRDGSRGHVFYAPLRIQPEHRYRLEAVRSDGATSAAETSVPSIPSADIAEVTLLVYSSGRIEAVQSVTWSGVDRAPATVEMWYRFSGSPRSGFLDIRIDYPTADQAPSQPGWTVVTQLSDDREQIVETIRPEDYLFLGMGMRIVVFDEQFVPPGGVFDADILSQPGAFSNVDNGFGFVGSVGRFDVEWVLDDETSAALGYVQPKTLH